MPKQLYQMLMYMIYIHNILSRVLGCAWRIRRVLDWIIGFIDALFTHTTRDYRQYGAIADLRTLYFTVKPAEGFSVFTSCILATIYNSVTITSNHTWSLLITSWFPSFHYSAIANSIQFCAVLPAGWRLRLHIILDSTLFYNTEHFCITTLHGLRWKHWLSC
jgi:hypothetical protein